LNQNRAAIVRAERFDRTSDSKWVSCFKCRICGLRFLAIHVYLQATEWLTRFRKKVLVSGLQFDDMETFEQTRCGLRV
jgi:hypothetical protein